ncbi:MAG: 16S rRNA (cytidine(1402)-2'-O)-methyltransferase [Beijerinckiaceae bacterium]
MTSTRDNAAGPERSASFTAFGLRAEAQPLAPGLHVVATPIGNLGDITFRALATLAAADAVIAEDTRVSKTLLAHYGIATPLVAYHEHNAAVIRPHLLARLEGGAALALISDAGTPLVSDPGFKLVAEALERGVQVTSAPGPSAVLAALVVAGLPTDRFFFEGFLPQKSAARRQRAAALKSVPGTLVMFESPRRLAESLDDLAAVLGDRQAAVCRELTKRFETVRRGSLAQLAGEFAAEPPPKGEIVIVVGPPGEPDEAAAQGDVDAKLNAALARHSVKDAAAIVAGETGQPRRKVYARALEIAASREMDPDEK